MHELKVGFEKVNMRELQWISYEEIYPNRPFTDNSQNKRELYVSVKGYRIIYFSDCVW